MYCRKLERVYLALPGIALIGYNYQVAQLDDVVEAHATAFN